MVRRVANFAELSDDVFDAVLDLLSGRYPSDDFAELRPRLVWDRTTGIVRAREGAGRLAITNGGTIPDRGLFGVFLPDGTRVGELDEEMVYESRRGEVFVLGASSWRIEDITRDRVVVVARARRAGQDAVLEGRQAGPAARARPRAGRVHARAARPRRATERSRGCARTSASTSSPRENLVKYLDDQREATGAVPDDRTIVVERFRDELGDWRICILSPFGQRVHAPWGLAIEARLAERVGPGAQVLWSDDGIVIRLPESEDRIPLDDLLFDPDEIEEEVVPRPAGHRVVRERVPRGVRTRAAAPPPPSRPAHGAVAAAPALRPTCWSPRRSTRRSRCCSRPHANACETCSTCRRSAR